MSEFVYIKQEDSMDCGLASLATILLYYNKSYSLNYLKLISNYNNKIGTNFLQLYNTAIRLGFNAIAIGLKSLKSLNDIELPCIAQIQITKDVMHFVVIYAIHINTIIIADPAKGIVELPIEEFSKCFTNKILLIFNNIIDY